MLPFMGSAQVFFTEDFEGTMNATTDLPTNWTESTLSTDGGWNTDNATNASSAYLTWPAPANGTIFAFTNDDDCNCDKSNDRMFLPVQNFTTYTAVSMSFDLYFNGGYGELGHVIVSTNGGTSFDTVYTGVGNAAAWQNGIAVSLSPYAGQGAVLIGFVYNDIAGWAYGMGIDDVSLSQLASPEDLEAFNAVSEYTRIPFAEAAAMDLGAVVTNNGVTNATDAIITSEVWSSSNGFSTPIFTQASGNNTVNVGDTVLISNGTYTPTAIASYIYRHIVSSVALNDGQPSNDTIDYAFNITPFTYARDDSLTTIGLGVNGTGNTSVLGINYTFTAASTVIASVQFGMTGILAGDTTALLVYNTDLTGMPTTLVDSIEHIMVTSGPTIEAVSIPGGLTLAPGTYFFGMREYISVNNAGLMGMDNIFTPLTGWGSVNAAPFDAIEDIGFSIPFYVRPQLAPPCSNSSNTAAAAICQGQTYTIGSSTYTMAGTYTDTLLLPGGCDSIVTTTLTVNTLPTVTLTGLAPLYCDDDAAVMLTGTPSGGTFAGPGVTGSMFDPAAAGAGNHTITYTYTDGNNCSASDSNAVDVSVCIGIADDMFSQIEISPNPNNGQFKVTGLVSGAQIEIMDLRGKVVLRSTASMNEEIVNLNGQSAGLYFVRITNENESRQYKVVVE
jgi:hypothetical protein